MWKLPAFVIIGTALVVLISSTSAATTKKLKCGPNEDKETEDVAGRILTIGTKRKFPETRAQLKEYCKEQVQLIDHLDQYKSQCLTGQTKSMVSVIAYSIKAVTNSYCKNIGSKRAAELLESAKCANRAPYGNCQRQFIERLWASENLTAPQKLAQTCCGYVEVAKCIAKETRGVKECTPKMVEINHRYIKRFFDASVDVMCGEYNEGTDKCDTVAEIPFKRNMSLPYPSSFYGPLIKVLADL